MAKLCALYSVSSGNSTYLENEGGAALLVDVGKTMKATREALAEMDGECIPCMHQSGPFGRIAANAVAVHIF